MQNLPSNQVFSGTLEWWDRASDTEWLMGHKQKDGHHSKSLDILSLVILILWDCAVSCKGIHFGKKQLSRPHIQEVQWPH